MLSCAAQGSSHGKRIHQDAENLRWRVWVPRPNLRQRQGTGIMREWKRSCKLSVSRRKAAGSSIENKCKTGPRTSRNMVLEGVPLKLPCFSRAHKAGMHKTTIWASREPYGQKLAHSFGPTLPAGRTWRAGLGLAPGSVFCTTPLHRPRRSSNPNVIVLGSKNHYRYGIWDLMPSCYHRHGNKNKELLVRLPLRASAGWRLLQVDIAVLTRQQPQSAAL